MKAKISAIVAIFVMGLYGCDSSTSSVGGSLTPIEDGINVKADSCFATSRTILAPDSILARTTITTIGRYTDPLTGALLESSYLTQLNCVENFEFPDSVYGVSNFIFPDWFNREMEGKKPYSAELKLYFSSLFGDTTNAMQFEVFPILGNFDAGNRYYSSVDPAQFTNLSEPLATAMVAPIDYSLKDSLLQIKGYYHNITIGLPDSIAKSILESYFSPGGKEMFASADAFNRNICKGFYVRCTQGDGTLIYVDKTVLAINFKYIDQSSSKVVSSVVAEFSGNNEVMQVTRYQNYRQESMLADSTCSYIRNPYGLLTEIELPIDEMKSQERIMLNSASMTLFKLNDLYQGGYASKIPSTLMLVRRDHLQSFFEKNNNVDNMNSYVASYNLKLNSYTFSNIAKMVEHCYDERQEWLKSNGLEATEQNYSLYSASHPNWNKMVLIPVKAMVDANKSVVGYIVDISYYQIRLLGGSSGEKIKIKTIYTSF